MAERTVGEKRADPLRRNRLQDASQMHRVIALICMIWQCPPHPTMQRDIILSHLWEVGRNFELAYILPICFLSAYKASTCPLNPIAAAGMLLKVCF